MIFSWWPKGKFLYVPLPKKVTFQGGCGSSSSSRTWEWRRADARDYRGFNAGFQVKGSCLYSQFHLDVQHLYPSQMSQLLMISEFLGRQKSLSRWTGRTQQPRWITSGSHTLTRQDGRRSWTYRGAKRRAPNTLLWVSVVTDRMQACTEDINTYWSPWVYFWIIVPLSWTLSGWLTSV